MTKALAHAAVDQAFERGVETLFAVLHAAPAKDQDAPVRFANGIARLVETRTRAMALIDSSGAE